MNNTQATGARSIDIVINKNGEVEQYTEDKVKRVIQLNSDGLDKLDQDTIYTEFVKSIYNNMPTHEIEKALILAASSLIHVHPDYDTFATRIFLQKIYREVLGESLPREYKEAALRKYFIHHFSTSEMYKGISSFDLEKLAEALVIERDEKFNFLGITNIYEKLLARDKNGFKKETPQMFWMRVAMGVMLNETEAREQKVKDLYDVYSQFYAGASTPVLLHSGMKFNQLSSCGGSVVDDTAESIFQWITDGFQLGKLAYGLGSSVSKIRAVGSPIHSTGIESSGPIPFLKILEAQVLATNRGGRKRGAHAVYIEPWHYEIDDFIKLRKNTGDERVRTHNLNTALWIPDLFMKRVLANDRWTLFDPAEVRDLGYDLTELYGKDFEFAYEDLEKLAEAGDLRITKQVPAKQLWKEMLASLYETGHPWLTWKDAFNVRNPNNHDGKIYSSNLCTEIGQNVSPHSKGFGDYFNCFLSSVNLAAHVQDRQINFGTIEIAVRNLVRALDNANDLNFYPVEQVKRGAMKYRSIGIGIMGLQDMLLQLGVAYDSEEATDVIDEVTEFISYIAIDESSDLAAEKGEYEKYVGSDWSKGILPIDTLSRLEENRGMPIDVDRKTRLDWDVLRAKVRKQGMRNGYVLSPAPNASLSLYLGCYPSIEPLYSNMYSKENMMGKFLVMNKYLIQELESRGLWTDEVRQAISAANGYLQEIDILPDDIKRVYKNAFEVDPMAQTRHGAVMAKWIDQSHSRNVFVKTTSLKVLNDIYMTLWKGGVKSTYYLRATSASTIEKSN